MKFNKLRRDLKRMWNDKNIK